MSTQNYHDSRHIRVGQPTKQTHTHRMPPVYLIFESSQKDAITDRMSAVYETHEACEKVFGLENEAHGHFI